MRPARRAWRLLIEDTAQAIALADKALALALGNGDKAAEAWARLARGFHLLYFSTPRDAEPELLRAQRGFDAVGDRAGHILAAAGRARAMWRSGRFRAAVEHVLPLRDEGLRVLRKDQRSVLLNIIAGCYSAQGDSEQAFAYMYQALRDARPARGHGYDAVLHCNLAHELLQLGDNTEALRHVDQGIAICAHLKDANLLSVLLINRVICLTELGRARDALPDVVRVRDLPADASGRGMMAAHFETLAVAALRAGEAALGSELVERALAAGREPIPDEHLELAVAFALRAMQGGDTTGALSRLQQVRAMAGDGSVEGGSNGAEGASLRMRCLYFLTLSELHEQRGDAARALAALRTWQRLHVERSQLASRARYQAAALHTELLRLQRKLDENVAQRRATERARAELASINQHLSRKVEQVESLQAALQQQATRDDLTGLFNRRHLNESLPAMFALTGRDTRPLAVAIIDLDHFKAVNDSHGHAIGDRLLAAFGRLLSANCRKSDVACRYGGEEFCLLMPRTDAATARRKVSTLLRRWRDEVFALEGITIAGLAFSAGVADSRQTPGSGEQLLRAADEALLEAKRSGRSRVLVADVPAPKPARATAAC